MDPYAPTPVPPLTYERGFALADPEVSRPKLMATGEHRIFIGKPLHTTTDPERRIRRCVHCKEWRPFAEMRPHRHSPFGISYRCIHCPSRGTKTPGTFS